MKTYMAYSRINGSHYNPMLVFADSVKQAKKVSYPYLALDIVDDWIDLAVRKIDLKSLFKQADAIKLSKNIPHVISNPIVCDNCNKLGMELNEHGFCENCECEYQEIKRTQDEHL